MTNIIFNAPLKTLNTLGLAASSKALISVTDAETIPDIIDYASQQALTPMVLGGGSNVVFSQNYDGLVIQLNTKGIRISETGEAVIVTACAGENWHQLVMHCLEQGIYGLENLALIPGNIGAAPIQNIGAYGVELQQVFHSLKGWDLQMSCWRELSAEQCQFGYRDSIFKHELKDQFIITEVSLSLSRTDTTNTHYRALADYLSEQHLTKPTPEQVAKAVIAIRSSKLPDPATLANAGSFFKNPLVSPSSFAQLHTQYPNMPHYPSTHGDIKLAAGWLLEQAGWKGRVLGNCSMHAQQALVLINTGEATGQELINFAKIVQADVAEKFSVLLEIEPRVY